MANENTNTLIKIGNGKTLRKLAKIGGTISGLAILTYLVLQVMIPQISANTGNISDNSAAIGVIRAQIKPLEKLPDMSSDIKDIKMYIAFITRNNEEFNRWKELSKD